MLKLHEPEKSFRQIAQPPSGGCVLKLLYRRKFPLKIGPAAFRRLCVETVYAKRVMALRRASRLQAAVC